MRPYSLPPELHLHQIQQSKYEDFFSRLSQYPTARLKKRKTWFHIFSIRMMSVNWDMSCCFFLSNMLICISKLFPCRFFGFCRSSWSRSLVYSTNSSRSTKPGWRVQIRNLIPSSLSGLGRRKRKSAPARIVFAAFLPNIWILGKKAAKNSPLRSICSRRFPSPTGC